jgi:hypothetical protein
METNYQEQAAGEIQKSVQKKRALIGQYGSFFGKDLLTVRWKNIDLEYNNKRVNNVITLTKPLRVIEIVHTTISAIAVDVDANGNAVVMFNNSQKMRFTIINNSEEIEFKVPDAVLVRLALKESEKKPTELSHPIYFSNLRALTDVVNAENTSEQKVAQKLANELLQETAAIEKIMAIQNEDVNEYDRECGIVHDEEHTIAVHVQTEESAGE